MSPFARKYLKYREGNLADFEEEEKEKFDSYVQKMAAEELEEGEANPVVYENMPKECFHCELTGGINRIGFSTADDPFFKAETAKYYPEAVVVSPDGNILAKINPNEGSSSEFSMTYNDDIRDPVLKINDDRKIQIILGAIKEPGTMIMLLVREFDNTGKPPPKEGEYDRAWFRLANEETNQTIDYSLVRKIDLPEEYQDVLPGEVNEDGEEGPGQRNEMTYLHGILYLDNSGISNKWVFESYKHGY